jgi:uncharacterized protein (DUF2147 family)
MKWSLTGTLALTAMLVASQADAAGIRGVWLTEKGEARIRIADCGAGLCGRIVWLREPLKAGKPRLDERNPDHNLRSRPLMGLVILRSLQPNGAPNEWKGSAYNADDGGVYPISIHMNDEARLKIEGCLGAFCDSERWTRTK